MTRNNNIVTLSINDDCVELSKSIFHQTHARGGLALFFFSRPLSSYLGPLPLQSSFLGLERQPDHQAMVALGHRHPLVLATPRP